MLSSYQSDHQDLVRSLELSVTPCSLDSIHLFFCLLYTAGDTAGHIISSISDVIKSIVLQQDIYHEYESASVVEAVIPILITFILCLLFLAWHEHNKKNRWISGIFKPYKGFST